MYVGVGLTLRARAVGWLVSGVCWVVGAALGWRCQHGRFAWVGFGAARCALGGFTSPGSALRLPPCSVGLGARWLPAGGLAR